MKHQKAYISGISPTSHRPFQPAEILQTVIKDEEPHFLCEYIDREIIYISIKDDNYKVSTLDSAINEYIRHFNIK